MSYLENMLYYECLKQDENLRMRYVDFWLNATKEKSISFATDKYGNYILGKVTLKQWFKTVHMPLFLDFIRWIIIDIVRGKVDRIFGIYMFCALFGEGKTISMVVRAEELKKKYPDIFIASNFGYKKQDFQIKNWKDLLNLPNRTVAMIDEIQGTFDSAGWQGFPKELLLSICQCRKQELMVLCSAQYYGDVSAQIRRLCMYIVQCSNIGGFDRMFKNQYFHRPKYERWYTSQGSDKPSKIQPYMLRRFVADDDTYNLYNTKEIVQSLMQ